MLFITRKKGYSYLIEEKFLSEKMTPLINKIYFNRLLLDQILIKQKKHSDKLVYENIKKELKKFFMQKLVLVKKEIIPLLVSEA